MRALKTWLMAVCLLGLAFGAMAQQAYLAAGLGRSNWNFDCGPRGCDQHTSSWRAAAGYRFNRVVALEGFYFDFRRARSSDSALDGELGGSAAGVQTLLGWDFGATEVAGKIGLATVRTDFRAAPSSIYPAEHRSNTELIGGLMVAYRMTPSLSIRFDADIVTVALNSDAFFYSRGADVTTFMLGLMYRF